MCRCCVVWFKVLRIIYNAKAICAAAVRYGLAIHVSRIMPRRYVPLLYGIVYAFLYFV